MSSHDEHDEAGANADASLATLRVLLVDDSATDVKLVVRAMRGQGRPLEHERVDGADDLRHALERVAWDVVLCDWSMPGFGALEALAIVREPSPARRTSSDVPFVIVSGTVGEATAVTAMRAGAHDFVLKDGLN
ncbi:MAG: response regulator, partial [Myxococcota bacterium]